MGGVRDAFLTTHWSLIGDIQAGPDENQVLVGHLLERYWKPVYCYLRQRGYDNDRSKDLTQGFFCEVVLDRNLTQRADQTKGRFRSFLLHALNHYLADQQRIASCKKRSPGTPLLSIDIQDPPALPSTVTEAGPEDSFSYAWKSTLLDQVLADVRTDCGREGLETHWRVFHDKVVRPILEDLEPPPLKTLCQKHGVENEAKISNMIVTVKRRFQSKLHKHVRNTVVSEDQVEGELKEILKLFPKKAQDSK